MTQDPEQLELDLEFPTYDHYTIKLSKGQVGALETVRTHTATTADDAFILIEGLLDTAAARDSVQWQYPEIQANGLLYGLAPGGDVYEISVVPPLTTALS